MNILIQIIIVNLLTLILISCESHNANEKANQKINTLDAGTISIDNNPLSIKATYNFPIIEFELSNVGDKPLSLKMSDTELYDLRIEAWRFNRGVVIYTPTVKEDRSHFGFMGHKTQELLPGSVLKYNIDLLNCKAMFEFDYDLVDSIISKDAHRPTRINLIFGYFVENSDDTSYSWVIIDP